MNEVTSIASTILIADDNHSEREALAKILNKENYSVLQAQDGEEALNLVRTHPVNLILTDLQMPNLDGEQLLKAVKIIQPTIEVIFISGHGTIEKAVDAIKSGAYDFLTKPFKKIELLRIIRKNLERQSLVLQNKILTEEVALLKKKEQLIGKSSNFQKIIDLAIQVASSEATVLITGESGTGKELFANLIHNCSTRKNAPFIKVNCAALPEHLLDSEFFGHERGSFTGAINQKPGRFELAHTGTIFLDEVAEMSPALQAKLLRVLQLGEFERVGGTKTLRVDIRILAASNRDLKVAVENKQFREDLYYRLNVISLKLPPLRERKEDIPLLVQHFMNVFKEKNKKDIKGIEKETIDILTNYGWPGNIRELENAIERAVVITKNTFISPSDLPSEFSTQTHPFNKLSFSLGTPLAEIEKQIIFETLRKTNGDKETAAKMLGISTRTIYRKLEDLEKDHETVIPS